MTDANEDQSRPRNHSKPTRRAWIMRGVVTPIFGLIAVACFVFGALNSTIWQPDHTIVASANKITTRYVLVDSGVLPLVDTSVTVDAQSNNDQNQQTCIAIGSAKDANGWLAGQAYTRITGMSTWETLSVADQKAQGNASTAQNQVSFADSDMWTSVKCDPKAATIQDSDVQASQVALIDFGQDETNADVKLHWVRQQVPNFALPWYFGGGLAAILAVLSASVFAMDPNDLRRRRDEALGTEEPTVSIREALAGSLSRVMPSRNSQKKHRQDHVEATESAEPTGAETTSTPTVVDHTAHNLVAEHAPDADNESTSTITAADIRKAAADANKSGAVGAAVTSAAQPVEETAEQSAETAQSETEPAAKPVTLYEEPVTETDVEIAATETLAGDAGDVEEATSEETTSVISQDELQAYFARLAQEVGTDEASAQNQPAPESRRARRARHAGAQSANDQESSSDNVEDTGARRLGRHAGAGTEESADKEHE